MLIFVRQSSGVHVTTLPPLSLNTDPANHAGSHQSYLILVSLNIDEKRSEGGRGRKGTLKIE